MNDVGATVAHPIETVFDFDVLPPNIEQSYKFKIRNDGDKPLHLLVGPKTCKCTAIKILDRIIAPAQTGEVQLTWKTVEFAKQFSHSGSVYTNDPDQQKIKFYIKGKVAREFGVSPSKVDFQRIIPDSKLVENEIFVFSGEWKDLQISNVTSTFGKDLSAELSPGTPEQLAVHSAASGFNLKLKLKPPTRPGWFYGKINFTVSGDATSFEHSIDVCGKVVRRISLSATNEFELTEDGVARIGRVESQLGKTIEFMLTVNDPQKAISIREVATEPSFVDVKLTPLNSRVEKHGVYKLKLTIPSGVNPSLFDREGSFGSVHLKFDHPRVHPLDFDLDFFVID